jgi:hypothetical protein
MTTGHPARLHYNVNGIRCQCQTVQESHREYEEFLIYFDRLNFKQEKLK